MTDLYARTASPKTEVRRCGSCEQAAVVCFQAWQHSFGGVASGRVTRDCRCQSCGAIVKLRDPEQIRITKIVGWVFIIFAIVPTLIIIPLVWSWRRAWEKNPLLPGAPMPAIRHRLGAGPRRCGACGQTAEVTNTVAHRTNGIPTGVTSDYACTSCKKTFTTESWGGIFFNMVFGLPFLAGAIAALTFGTRTTHDLEMGGICILIGGVLVLLGIRRILTALHNPALD